MDSVRSKGPVEPHRDSPRNRNRMQPVYAEASLSNAITRETPGFLRLHNVIHGLNWSQGPFRPTVLQETGHVRRMEGLRCG